MRVLISGQAAAAVSLEQPRYLFALDREPVPAVASGDAWRIFDGCSDVQEYDLSAETVAKAVERAWAYDRALRIFLFLIDPTEPEDLLSDYAQCVEELLVSFDLEDELLSPLSGKPFPTPVDAKRVRLASTSHARVLALFERVLGLQGHIMKVREAFDKLSPSYFESDADRQRLNDELEMEGAFSELALTLERGADISFLRLRIANRHLANREAVTQWTAMLQSGTTRRAGRVHEDQDSEEDLDWEFEPEAKRLPSHQTYQFVRAEQAEVIRLLKIRDLDGARSRTDDLIHRQRPHSTNEQIAKTLSFLAQAAKLQEVPELQLEWARTATAENPVDPRTFGHLSEAYVAVGKYAEAESALDEAERVGGRLFAETGRARIMRVFGQYEQARETFTAVAAEFNDDPEVEFAWMGAADTLRDMGRVDEALAEYRDLVNRWPLSIHLWAGYAFALLDAGRIDEAIVTFGKSSAQRQNKFALNGRAYALRLAGKLQDALAIYDQVIEHFPNDHFALCGRAEIFRLQGRHQIALAAYDLAATRSPYISAPLLGRAATLAEIGSANDSLKIYADLEQRFANEPAAVLDHARLLRRLGEFTVALQKVDDLIQKMPNHVAAKILRAQIFQSMGRFDEALTALDVITTNHPFHTAALGAKANLLIAMGRFEEAEQALPDATPKTQAEWSRYLLRCLLIQNKDGDGAAASRLQRGLAKCPFFYQRRNLRSALASLELRRQRFRDARRVVEGAPTEVSDVIAMHAYAAAHRPGHARGLLDKIQANEKSVIIISLAAEIARRTKLVEDQPIHSERWIVEAERSLILLDAA